MALSRLFPNSGYDDGPVFLRMKDFVPLRDAGDPRQTFWALLDLWEGRDRRLWWPEEERALWGQIEGFWIRYGKRAEAWWRAWSEARKP